MRFKSNLPAIRAEAAKLGDELVAARQAPTNNRH
jgi:hypothetical protein